MSFLVLVHHLICSGAALTGSLRAHSGKTACTMGWPLPLILPPVLGLLAVHAFGTGSAILSLGFDEASGVLLIFMAAGLDELLAGGSLSGCGA
jgi:ABC-type molybdate transport system permease subunit